MNPNPITSSEIFHIRFDLFYAHTYVSAYVLMFFTQSVRAFLILFVNSIILVSPFSTSQSNAGAPEPLRSQVAGAKSHWLSAPAITDGNFNLVSFWYTKDQTAVP